MNDLQDKIIFSGTGLDQDSDTLAIGKGKSRYRLNVIEKIGDLGVLTNIKGNSALTGSLPSGTNRCVGVLEDGENGWVIFFIYNSNNYHSILYADESSFDYILDGTDSGGAVGTTLNFQNDRYIDSGIVGNEDDRYLVWTDGYNEPRIINITMALNFTAGSGTPIYTSIDSQTISFYKKPLLEEIDIFFDTSSNTGVNNLRGKIWQFAIRKKFYDNTYSVLSHYSEVLIPQLEENANGIFTSELKNSLLSVSFDIPDDDEIVSEYQLCYRQVDIASGVPGSWFLSNNEPSITFEVAFEFTNDSSGVVLSDVDADRFYDYVPDLADHLFVIDSNRVVFGGITEGKDNLVKDDLDVTFNHTRFGNLDSGLVSVFTDSVPNTNTSLPLSTSKLPTDDYHYSFFIYDSVGAVTYEFQYVNTYNVSGTDVASYLATEIATVSGITTTPSGASFTVTNNIGNTITVNMIVFGPHAKQSSFKCGSKNYFGLQYYKDGKPWFIQANNDFEVEIPFQYEAPNTVEYSGATSTGNINGFTVASAPWEDDELVGATATNSIDSSTGIITANTGTSVTCDTGTSWSGANYSISYEHLLFYNKIDWEIDHLPPEEATHYQWVYLGSNYDYYEYYYLEGDVVSEDGNYTLINKDFITYFKNGYNNSIEYGFDIQAGDRIRFIGFCVSLSDRIRLHDEYYDFEILEVDSTYIKIKNIISLFDLTRSSDNIVEIYRPRVSDVNTGIYQAVSPIIETYDDSGTIRHRGVNQDQTSSLAATGVFNSYYSNCFMFPYSYLNVNNISDWNGITFKYGISESYPVSLIYDSRINDFGKQNVVNEFSERKYLNKIRYGGKFLDESGVNFMTRFDFDDERVVDDRNGLITKIQQKGNTLKVYQERDIVSFYLGAEYATDPNGTEQLAYSSQVMSSIGRKSDSDYGCSNFTSYVNTPEYAYFFDIDKGCILKDTKSGIICINGEMDSYFKDKSKAILEDTATIDVYSGWDEENKLLIITFVDRSDDLSTINETIGYYQPGNYWMSFYSYIPEMYGAKKGAYFLSFNDGTPYRHNNNSTRNNFYSAQYSSQIWCHATEAPTENKVFNSIEIGSVGQWSAPTNGDILITKPIQMSSRLKAGKFVYQEGLYRSDFLKDMNTTGSALVNSLFNGRNLRGHEITIKLTNSDTSQSELNYVTVRSQISK